MQKTDAGGKVWQVWARAAKGQRLRVRDGKVRTVRLSQQIRVRPSAKPHGDTLRLMLAIRGDFGMGITLMSGDQRAPVVFALTGDGKAIVAGKLNYG